ncbi:MAG: Na+/H+ antiporter NhaC family protein [Planctomycetaceae bacterium]|nr:Na+/H+ antiporter NhaC family protein [Planctomycetaceae bacterium]
MRTLALAVLSTLLLAAVWLLPEADVARLAALEAHTVLEQKVGLPPEEGAPDERRKLSDVILDGKAMIENDGQRARLSLFGVRFDTNVPTEDLTVHELARRSLVRGLRDAAAKRGLSLDIEGEFAPTTYGQRFGATFLVSHNSDTGSIGINYTQPDSEPASARLDGWQSPARSSLFPPLVAILLAILFRKPIVALFSGVAVAMVLLRLRQGSGIGGALALSLPDVATRSFWPQLADTDKLLIIGFVVAMLSMVGVMTRSGGIRGLVDLVARLAKSARSTQIATWLMGLAVFFDDYANCILVGTTMRPLADRYRISREKLSYLVDSTAAPIAGISLFSTWIAYEVSTFAPQLPSAGLDANAGYAVFLETLPYRFYCIFTLFFGALIVFSGRDFGPMLKAERRARTTGQLVRPGGQPLVGEDATALEPAPGLVPRAHRAILPVLTFVFVTLFEIFRVGSGEHPGLWSDASLDFVRKVTTVLADGESSRAILIGATTGLVLACLLATLAGAARHIPGAMYTTLKNMGVAIAILYLAWMIGSSCSELGTANYLTELLGDRLAPPLLPTLLFLLSAGIAFSTGTSWGTMSILLPLVVGLSFSLGERDANIGGHLLMLLSIGAVLEGSIFGDHCSPISDTTILSSTASASDHIDHTRTQMVYALVTMAVALCLGYFPCAFMGWPAWAAIAAGCGALLMIVFVFGRKSETPVV